MGCRRSGGLVGLAGVLAASLLASLLVLAADVPRAGALPSGGDWIGEVGSDGYVLAAFDGEAVDKDRVNLPPAAVTVDQGRRHRWASSTSDARALEDPTASTRRAGTWHDETQLRVRLSFSDPYVGQLRVYAVDWDSDQRAQTVALEGAASGSVPMSSFVDGAWATFNVSVAANSTVWVTATREAGTNAVISGVFLGPGGELPRSEPQGDWINAYGSEGYALAAYDNTSGDRPVMIPAGLTLVEGTRYRWGVDRGSPCVAGSVGSDPPPGGCVDIVDEGSPDIGLQ